MTGKLGLLAFATLAMAACADGGTGTVSPSGGSAGAEGIGYCDSPPAEVEEMEAWEERCMPDRR
jgi:hypothetical protein